MRRFCSLAVVVVWCCGGAAPAAWAVTPGWECIPTTAGQPVMSGGTGSAPSCSAGSTAVLAPTYVSSGVGSNPTVQFAAVNVQITNGAGATASVNGTGNLVLGYDESPGSQIGSHDLVLGRNQTFTGYGELVGGYGNTLSGHWASALGYHNTVSGSYALAAGDSNKVAGMASSALGGFGNTVHSRFSAILGGKNVTVSTCGATYPTGPRSSC
jgi:hypothetical protein